MTAVASPPSLQPLPRLGWTSSGSGGEGGLDAGEVSRMFSRKSPQRSESSGSIPSASSVSSTTSASTISSKDIKGRPSRNTGPEWTAATGASTNGLVNTDIASIDNPIGRPPPVPPPATPNSLPPSQTAGLNQAAPVVPSQKNMQLSQQANTTRMAPAPPNATPDPPALLVLLPINGTFERKQINVPLYPEVLRIGRQTNAKTVPTPLNGYFDSKVLSRQHAEVWAERNGKIWIRDVKSSNGTFVNGQRLSPESRDSEPHELRENDILELGIDIVSEDQKSIVHHKVSAKVEHAGIHQNPTSVLDLNIGDIDPGTNGGVLAPMYPQQMPVRGRGGSQGSVSNNGRVSIQSMPPNLNGMMPRHMNAWMAPISIEQVVKRLGNELKQAKQQSSDLHRTTEFFAAVLNSEPGTAPPKPPASILPQPPQMNGIASPQKTSPLSPFAGPPAPPPRQPLPEKPDAPRSIHADNNLINAIKRLDMDKDHPLVMNSSPTKADGSASQILSLAEALQATRRELEGQSNRVKALEESLKQERQARETAEERARHLLEYSKFDTTAPFRDVSASDSVSEADSEASQETIAPSSMRDIDQVEERTNTGTPSVNELQNQLDLMRMEMQDMKLQMEEYKHRAEQSEQRAAQAEDEKTSLVVMVEKLRAEQQKSQAASHSREPSGSSSSSIPILGDFTNGTAGPSSQQAGAHSKDGSRGANGSASESQQQMQQLQSAVVQALSKQQQDNHLAQSAPFASMLGVVLIGVGLMTYLNGWPKADH